MWSRLRILERATQVAGEPVVETVFIVRNRRGHVAIAVIGLAVGIALGTVPFGGLTAMTAIGITYVAEMFPARSRGTYQGWVMFIGLCGIPAAAIVALIANARNPSSVISARRRARVRASASTSSRVSAAAASSVSMSSGVPPTGAVASSAIE